MLDAFCLESQGGVKERHRFTRGAEVSGTLSLHEDAVPPLHGMRLRLVRWDNMWKNADLWQAYHRLRHDIFVGRRRWYVPSYQEWEFDQYDNARAIYVIVERAKECIACVRFIPTIYPYMLENHFSDLMGCALPKSSSVWELTRLGVKRELAPRVRRLVLLYLLRGSVQTALDAGVRTFLAVAPMGIFVRTFAMNGLPVSIYKDRARYMGCEKLVAAEISLSSRSLMCISTDIDVAYSHL